MIKDLINKLINLANYLDESGLRKEADRVDALIKKANWIDYIKEPGEERECLTPDAQFHMHIGDDEVSVSVDLPMKLPELPEDELQEMDDAMHDAMEAILAKYFEDEAPLFVYGTLRKGEKNHKKLKGAKSLGESTLKGFRNTEGEGPAIVPGDKEDSVDGELYDVDLETLKEIDKYEGEEYIRELVELEDGSKAYAYVYFPIEKIKAEDIHDAADIAGVKWDDDEEFMDKTEDLVGKRHLDDMTKKELHVIIRAIKTRSFHNDASH